MKITTWVMRIVGRERPPVVGVFRPNRHARRVLVQMTQVLEVASVEQTLEICVKEKYERLRSAGRVGKVLP